MDQPINSSAPSTIDLVSPADHDAGFKHVEVTLRDGSKQTVKLTAPNWRKAMELPGLLQAKGDTLVIVQACRVDDCGCPPPWTSVEDWMNRLTLASASLVLSVSYALAFGNEAQKKMQAAGLELMQKIGPTDSGPNSPSSLPASATLRLNNTVCPNCGFSIASPASANSIVTFAPSSSPPAPA